MVYRYMYIVVTQPSFQVVDQIQTIHFLRKSFRENNDVDVKFFVGLGTLCLCVLSADNNEI